MKNWQMKKDTTCKYILKGQTCPNQPGCPFSHAKPKAAPAQPEPPPKAPKPNPKPPPEDAAPADPKAKAKPKQKPKGTRPRSATPGPQGQQPTGADPKKLLPCFPCSRNPNNLKGGCGKDHRGLTGPEKLERDRRGEAMVAAGNPIGYARTDMQAAQAKANVRAHAAKSPNSAAGSQEPPKFPKGTGKGKPKAVPCWHFTDSGKCNFGKNCKYRGDTPNHS